MIHMKDMNPQFLNVNTTQSAANTYTQTPINLPINPAATIAKGKVRVMEILKIYVYITPDTLAEDAYIAIQLCTKSQSAILNVGTGVSDFIIFQQVDYQLVTSGAVAVPMPFISDLTDGAGNGLLVGVPVLYFGVNSAGQGGACACSVKILYRYKDVDTTEYIGIVQSQQ